jgi:hypothetical protein
MGRFIAILGLTVVAASAAPAQLAAPDAGSPSPDSVAALARPPDSHAAEDTSAADPYAPLWHCQEEVRRFLSVSTESVARRLKALRDCVAGAERRPSLDVVDR